MLLLLKYLNDNYYNYYICYCHYSVPRRSSAGVSETLPTDAGGAGPDVVRVDQEGVASRVLVFLPFMKRLRGSKRIPKEDSEREEEEEEEGMLKKKEGRKD